MPLERLDKILASQNVGSRKDAAVLIRRGAVMVNGKAARKADEKADPQTDEITVSGQPLAYRRYIYIMLNKPKGVLSAARDSRQKTVLDLLPPELSRRGLFPAGRLDKDTTGLLVITDDGEFAHKMLAPKSGITKLYEAHLSEPVGEEDVEAFAAGLHLDSMECLPARLEPLPDSHARVWIMEGKFHQVKKMFAGRGKQVLELKRLQIGGLMLDSALKEGECRLLSAWETASLLE